MVTPVFAIFATSVMLQGAPGSPALGTLNSFNGNVWINGALVSATSTGRAVVEPGHPIRTGEGMAELLLSPGTFVRLGPRSQLTLQTADSPDIRIRLDSGETLIEVLAQQPPIVLEQNSVNAVIRNPELYDFNKKRGLIAVIAGEARFDKGGKEITVVNGYGVTTRAFHELDTLPRHDSPVLAWSRQRSKLLSLESAGLAQTLPVGAGSLRNPAWAWNTWSSSYTYVSASGAVTGAFGWPYYSPGSVPNYAPAHRPGDGWLYGPPVLSTPDLPPSPVGAPQDATPRVPLTAPGEPQFPTNRF